MTISEHLPLDALESMVLWMNLLYVHVALEAEGVIETVLIHT